MAKEWGERIITPSMMACPPTFRGDSRTIPTSAGRGFPPTLGPEYTTFRPGRHAGDRCRPK
jgi:hypothetical protein